MEFSEHLQLDRMVHWPRFLRHSVCRLCNVGLLYSGSSGICSLGASGVAIFSDEGPQNYTTIALPNPASAINMPYHELIGGHKGSRILTGGRGHTWPLGTAHGTQTAQAKERINAVQDWRTIDTYTQTHTSL